MAKGNKRFTIYDKMEADGTFEANPANASCPDYKGPVRYPKMFYHPEGKTKLVRAPEIVVTPMGPKEVGALYEIESVIAKDAAEAKELAAKGWHDHPAKAIAASGGEAPATSPAGQIAELEAKLAELQAQLAEAQTAVTTPPSGARLTAKTSEQSQH